jgi:protein CpxP
MKKLVILGATLVSTALAATTANLAAASVTPQLRLQSASQNADWVAQDAQGESSDEVVIDIEITPEQKAAIEAIYAEYAPQLEAAATELAAEAAYMDEITGPATPSEDLRTQRQKLVEADIAFEDLLFERLMAVRDVLTLEQREDFNQQVEEALN